MKSLFQFLVCLFFVSFLLGQETAYDPSHQNRNAQSWQERDPWSNFKDPAQRNKFGRERQANSARSEMQRPFQSPNPMHKISGSGVDTAWVRHYSSGLIPGNDVAKDIVIDQFGNVYVTGQSFSGNPSDPADYATIKYNSAGDTVWLRRYNGPGNDEDIPGALTIDASGNVYVTGRSASTSSFWSQDYATIKYNPAGDAMWVRRYNGPANSNDGASALAVDASGNVYVTGWSSSGGFIYDYATIKYNSNGDSMWVRRYNGTANYYDGATSLAVDATGNVYVTGSSGTIKYSPGGAQLWMGTHAGNALALDVSGNVYVTGTSDGSSTFSDYATIKYNSNGDTLWVRRYDGTANNFDWAKSLAVDGSGNVYVTGSSYGPSTSLDYATIKYNSNGDSLWVRRYNGPGIYGDLATSVAVDASGNVYVTGISSGSNGHSDYATIKYNSNGDTLWVRRYNGPGNSGNEASSLAVDGSGNVHVTGTSSADFATVKYNPAGDAVWVRRYDGPKGGYDGLTALAIDAIGNVYVTGQCYSGSSYDYATIKYTPAGDTMWVRRYNGQGNGYDYPTALVVDASGNVYVTGNSSSADTSFDYATIKYNPAGDAMWVRRYNGPKNLGDYANSLAVDASGNVYVTGISAYVEYYDWEIDSYELLFDYATIKYNSNGDSMWVRRYNTLEDGSSSRARSLAVDGSGNVYVTGSSYGPSTFSDYATIKYNSNGDTLWVRRYNGPGNSGDHATSLAVDGSGNVHVTGTSGTIKYSSDGNQLWVGTYGGIDIAVGGSGNVYVTGSSGSDYATIKYNSNGDTLWMSKYDGPGYDSPSALAIDEVGNVYVTGTSSFDPHTWRYKEYATVKYSNSGKEEWVARYRYGSTSTPCGIVVDKSQNVVVAGSSSLIVVSGLGGQYSYTVWSTCSVIKYKQTPTSVREISHTIPSTFALEQNYPNPFNPSTTIRYALPSSAHVKLTIHDILGREIATLVNEEQSAGWKEVEWNATNVSSGIYFYKLVAGNFVHVKKMLVVK